MANSSGTHHQDANPTNGHGNSGNESSGAPLKHNPGISTDWSVEEQAILEDGLNKYREEQSILRYAKIAMQLQNKTVRDVALRSRWMTKKEISKRRKEDIARKSKERKERVFDLTSKQSHFMASPNVLTYAAPMDNDDRISYNVMGGVMGELLEQNAKAFDLISSNLSTMQVQENISLFCQTRDNILRILNELNDSPEVMKQMPPLPVRLDEELANSILPRPNLPMK